MHVLRTTTTHHMVSFIDFYFHFLAYVQTSRGSDLDFASFVFYKLLYLPMFICYFSDIHSEPGLPVDKHVVNEHHVIRKSPALHGPDATQEKCLYVMHFNVPSDWFETNSRHQKRYSGPGCSKSD